MNGTRLIAASLGFAVAFSMVLASPVHGGEAVAPRVTVSARVATVAPDSLTILWRFDLAEDWHVYGRFRNDTGFAPAINLDLPTGWSAEPLRWPVPERHVTAGEILDHVYHDALVVPQTLRRPAHATTGEITAQVSWLVCNQICIPGDTTLVFPVPQQADPEAAGDLESVLASIPGPLAADAVQVSSTPDAVEIVAPGATGITAIPGEGGPFLVDLLADGHASGDHLRLRLRPGTGSPEPLKLLLIIDHSNAPRTAGTIVIR